MEKRAGDEDRVALANLCLAIYRISSSLIVLNSLQLESVHFLEHFAGVVFWLDFGPDLAYDAILVN